LNGVMAGDVTGNSAIAPYNECQPNHPSNDILHQEFDNNEVYSENFEKWLSSDQEVKEEGRYYFYNAFMHATSIEEFTTKESLGGSSVRHNRHHFRTSHDFIFRKLLSVPDEELANYILLLMGCANGGPDVLTEIMERFFKHSNQLKINPLICSAFGHLAIWTNENVKNILGECVRSSMDWGTALSARIAILNIFVRFEGLSRMNRQGHRIEYESATSWLTDQLSGVEKLLSEIVLASQFCRPPLCTYLKVFDEDRKSVPDELEQLCRCHVFKGSFGGMESLVHDLINTDDYVGLCLMIADQFEKDGRSEVAKSTFELVCRGFVVAAHHNQALRHLAVCYHRLGETLSANGIASKLASQNPDEVDYQLLKLHILTSITEMDDEAITCAERLRNQYILNIDQERELDTIEATLEASS